MRRRLLVILVAIIIVVVFPTGLAFAQSGGQPASESSAGNRPESANACVSAALQDAAIAEPRVWSLHRLQPGESLSCLARRSAVTLQTVAEANRLLNPAALIAGQEARLPDQEAVMVVAAHRNDTPLTVALTHALPFWEVVRRNPLPMYAGKEIVLPGEDSGSCLPYPLVAMDLSPQPVVRGRTAILAMQVAEPAACEISYLGQTEPCYPLDATHLFALIGLASSTDPGTYAMEIRLQANGLETALTTPLVVEAGRYGFQFISPSPSLAGLMDEALMQGEMDYLAPWREIRTPERSWQFPLGFPLSVQVPVSADYGDKRSYGGMVDGYHSGVDYCAWTGLPALAPADGVVLMAEKLQVRGNAVLIDHGWGLVTGYWHLSRIDVQVGQRVKRGEQIGLVGNTGLSTGAHLHWEVWVNGIAVDGKQWLDPDALGALHFPAASDVAEEADPRSFSLH